MRANTSRHYREGNTNSQSVLLAAVEGSGSLMFAEIAMRKAVNAEKKARS
jgi:hypothetical protein